MLLVVAVLLAFLPALFADFLNWDDNYTVLDNPHIHSLDGETVAWAFSTFTMGHYQPLSWLSLALDHAIWGMNPLGFHLSNLVLHSATALLVLLLLRLALSSLGIAQRSSQQRALLEGSFWMALFWAVHPMRVESVVWVTERRDVLSGLLLVACVVAYLKARSPASPEQVRLGRLVAVLGRALCSQPPGQGGWRGAASGAAGRARAGSGSWPHRGRVL